MSRLLRKFLRTHKGKMFRFSMNDGQERKGQLVKFGRKYLTISDYFGNITLVKRSDISTYKNFLDRK